MDIKDPVKKSSSSFISGHRVQSAHLSCISRFKHSHSQSKSSLYVTAKRFNEIKLPVTQFTLHRSCCGSKDNKVTEIKLPVTQFTLPRSCCDSKDNKGVITEIKLPVTQFTLPRSCCDSKDNKGVITEIKLPVTQFSLPRSCCDSKDNKGVNTFCCYQLPRSSSKTPSSRYLAAAVTLLRSSSKTPSSRYLAAAVTVKIIKVSLRSVVTSYEIKLPDTQFVCCDSKDNKGVITFCCYQLPRSSPDPSSRYLTAAVTIKLPDTQFSLPRSCCDSKDNKGVITFCCYQLPRSSSQTPSSRYLTAAVTIKLPVTQFSLPRSCCDSKDNKGVNKFCCYQLPRSSSHCCDSKDNKGVNTFCCYQLPRSSSQTPSSRYLAAAVTIKLPETQFSVPRSCCDSKDNKDVNTFCCYQLPLPRICCDSKDNKGVNTFCCYQLPRSSSQTPSSRYLAAAVTLPRSSSQKPSSRYLAAAVTVKIIKVSVRSVVTSYRYLAAAVTLRDQAPVTQFSLPRSCCDSDHKVTEIKLPDTQFSLPRSCCDSKDNKGVNTFCCYQLLRSSSKTPSSRYLAAAVTVKIIKVSIRSVVTITEIKLPVTQFSLPRSCCDSKDNKGVNTFCCYQLPRSSSQKPSSRYLAAAVTVKIIKVSIRSVVTITEIKLPVTQFSLPRSCCDSKDNKGVNTFCCYQLLRSSSQKPSSRYLQLLTVKIIKLPRSSSQTPSSRYLAAAVTVKIIKVSIRSVVTSYRDQAPRNPVLVTEIKLPVIQFSLPRSCCDSKDNKGVNTFCCYQLPRSSSQKPSSRYLTAAVTVKIIKLPRSSSQTPSSRYLTAAVTVKIIKVSIRSVVTSYRDQAPSNPVLATSQLL
ncbi:hypothetical protein J6590_100061 [Homalodisca vitripennis]|nr:hypothetical protein J6590_100061 [Homalodisca vitripennis]